MAKSRPTAEAPDKSFHGSSAVILIVGAILVIALVAFSFTRSLRTPAAAPVPSTEIAQPSPSPQAAPAMPGPGSAAAPALPPMASPRGDAPVSMTPPLAAPADAPATQAQLAAVPRIEVGDLLQKIESKQVTVIDVRDADSYRARHIPGALHIPLSFIAGEVPYLPKDKPIVTYCTWPAEESSAGAALKLEQAGITNVSALRGGLDEWARSGYPVESGVSK